jgi:hypothetical protein
MKLTVFFDGQFWVGVVEAQTDDGLKVARHLFGAEPTDTEVFAFVQRALPALLDEVAVALPAAAAVAVAPAINPKRRKREAAAEAQARGISTYAQEALKREIEARQHERQQRTRQQQDEEREYKRARKVQKAREKHRGH